MSRTRQIFSVLALMMVGCTLGAQTSPAPAVKQPVSAAEKITPPMPLPPPSPVDSFRKLLAMTPLELNDALTNRTPDLRERTLAKVREYKALSADERELRLQATDLRWYLTPLMRMEKAQRETRLAQVPEQLRELVKARLQQWDIVPPPLQKELLANDQAPRYFAQVAATNKTGASVNIQKSSDPFNRFFELTAAEKKKALTMLSETERAQMEKALQSFTNLPQQQRIICIRNYAKFAGMTAAERAEFLKNAEKWSQMSPQERQSWRDLVQRIPKLPPMPPPVVPQNIMPRMADAQRHGIATNRNLK